MDDDEAPPFNTCCHCLKEIPGISPDAPAVAQGGVYHLECHQIEAKAISDRYARNEAIRRENYQKQVDAQVGPPLCSLCGASCCMGDFDNEYGLVRTHVSGGYWSTPGLEEGALDDFTSYHFNLCEFCLDWLFQKCSRPLLITDYQTKETLSEPWKPAAQRVASESWRNTPGPYLTESARRAVLRTPLRVDFESLSDSKVKVLDANGRELQVGEHVLVADSSRSSIGIMEAYRGELWVRLLREPWEVQM